MVKSKPKRCGDRDYITIWVDPEFKEKVRTLAKTEDRSMSNMFVVLAKRGLKAENVPKQ